LRAAPYAPYCDMPQPWPQPEPRIVKLPDLAETAESARAGIVVSTAEMPMRATATAPPRSRLIQRLSAPVGEEAMTNPFVGKWP
jgi:hypothetical protein